MNKCNSNKIQIRNRKYIHQLVPGTGIGKAFMMFFKI